MPRKKMKQTYLDWTVTEYVTEMNEDFLCNECYKSIPKGTMHQRDRLSNKRRCITCDVGIV